MIYWLDCDVNGADSIERLIKEGKVQHIVCDTFVAFEKAIVGLLPKVTPEDLVIVDTVTSLANTTRGDMKLGTDLTASLWDQRSIFFSDKNYLTVYEAAGQSIMRRIKNLRARGARIITVCHEDEQLDPATLGKKRAPQVNEALYRSLLAASSDVFRLYALADDELNQETGEVKYKADTRFLQLRNSEEAVAKFHVEREQVEKIPSRLSNPTLPRLYKALAKRPSWCLLYGPPGAGKTSLAVSEAS